MEIIYQENQKEYTTVTINEDLNKLYLIGDTTKDKYLEITFPFKINKIPPNYRNADVPHEHVFVFKNKYFSEYDICEVRNTMRDDPRLGFLFKPNIIFEEDSTFLFKEDEILKTAIYRSFISLFKGTSSLKAKQLLAGRELDFRFETFFQKDIIVGVFPYDWNPNFNDSEITEILFNLYLNGFYLLKETVDHTFSPSEIPLQKQALDLLTKHTGSYRRYLDIISLSGKVKENSYCGYYIKEIIKQNENEISKFHQLYGLVEIFKDVILKYEINEKICENKITNSNITGNKLQNEIREISKDSYCVSKLFNKYRKGSEGNLDTVSLEILYFLESCRDKIETDLLKDFPQIYYFLRNIIVHDIQFLFIGDETKTISTRKELSRITLQIEYVIIETLRSLKL